MISNLAPNKSLIDTFLEYLAQGDIEKLLPILSDDFVWQVAGDNNALPWIGKLQGKNSINVFLENYPKLIEPISFDIHDTIYQPDKAVLIGHLVSKVKATGKVIDSDFVSIVTIKDNKISGYQLFEDSFMVSNSTISNQ